MVARPRLVRNTRPSSGPVPVTHESRRDSSEATAGLQDQRLWFWEVALGYEKNPERIRSARILVEAFQITLRKRNDEID
jgi:hypothetical protein